MKDLIYTIILILVFSSCHDKIDLGKMSSNGKLVVYCFPCSGDTIAIKVSRSMPTNTASFDSLKIENVKCTIDDQSLPVFYKGRDDYRLPTYSFYAVGKASVGSKVELQIQAKGLPVVSSVAILPPIPEITKTDIDTVYSKGEWFTQLKLTFKNPHERACYAVRVIRVEQYQDETNERIMPLNVDGEPLLNNNSDSNVDFDTSNDYYHDMYVFDNSQIADSAYTLHLNVQHSAYAQCYRAQLFRITSDYFKFLKSINDIENNSMSNYGMSLMTPTFTNIANGIGILGAYSIAETEWLGKIKI